MGVPFIRMGKCRLEGSRILSPDQDIVGTEAASLSVCSACFPSHPLPVSEPVLAGQKGLHVPELGAADSSHWLQGWSMTQTWPMRGSHSLSHSDWFSDRHVTHAG